MQKATFIKENHTYWLGSKQLISVTQLLKKHGLASSYGNAPAEVLRLKAERGTLIHEEIERYIKHGELGFTSEQDDFIRLSSELGLKDMVAEEIVNDDLVAGTADLMAKGGAGSALVDFKTSISIDKEACRWQLSLYERLSGHTFDEFYVFHLCDNSKYIPLERIPSEDVNKLLECERNGTIYQPRALIVSGDLLAAAKAAEQAVAVIETQKKEAEAIATELRNQLCALMAKQGIKSFETSDKAMLITYIEPTTKETIDSKRLKEEQPEIAGKYTKKSNIKGSVRITLRGQNAG
jgi:hypothetical protein